MVINQSFLLSELYLKKGMKNRISCAILGAYESIVNISY